ncbi:hypothetical protein SDC9_112421 [bioreactor metagenome]|uniref:Uncharacterized protein n=1 Tax=bioreactor metagenome TaxID=1076179 RepID=A0A645BUR7_9ZZZZ
MLFFLRAFAQVQDLRGIRRDIQRAVGGVDHHARARAGGLFDVFSWRVVNRNSCGRTGL